MVNLSTATNAVLRCLPDNVMESLAPHLEAIELPVRMQLERPYQAIQHVYFPTSGFASIVANGGGDAVEVGMVGREGVTATAVILGAVHSPHDTYIQSAGEGFRIVAGELLNQIAAHAALGACLRLSCHVSMVQTTHTSLSNSRGKLEERLGRWLLMAHDRCNSDVLPITHDFLAVMLGVRRPGVTVALNELTTKGVIRTTRGHVEITDRQGLEDTANGSYGVPEAEHARLFNVSKA